MTKFQLWLVAGVALVVSAIGGRAISAQDKYTLQVPGGLGFSEFKGYEDWSVVSISENGGKMAVILGNPEAIEAFRSGLPAAGKHFPDGARMAKVHWIPRKREDYPGPPTVPRVQHDVDFMVKDSKRFTDPDSGGWGYAEFEYDDATATFRPGNESDSPPQEHDAKCGVACHTLVEDRDFVFTEYGGR